MFLVLELGTVGDTEPSTWETCHPQWRRSGWGSWWETLGSSPTWRFFSNCWEQMLTVSCAFKVGVNVKDGGKYAFIGMESREAGDAVISALHLLVWSFIYTHIIFFPPPCLGGEGEGDHCEVEGGGDVDVPRPLLWEKQLRHLRRVRPLQAQEESCSLRKFGAQIGIWYATM